MSLAYRQFVTARADIGVIGGTGLYALLDDGEYVRMSTPYGDPSGRITLHTFGDWRVAFLARHGERHEYPPHHVPYRANVWALAHLGVTRILAPCAVGSLRADITPGSVVVPDQLIDRTQGRSSTFHDDKAVHISFADPYCAELRAAAALQASFSELSSRDGGTVVVIQGPRFSTRAEAEMHRRLGGDVVNMTALPEAALAREIGCCYCNLAVVTDWDAGVGSEQAVTQAQVMSRFADALTAVRGIVRRTIEDLPARASCRCSQQPQPV